MRLYTWGMSLSPLLGGANAFCLTTGQSSMVAIRNHAWGGRSRLPWAGLTMSSETPTPANALKNWVAAGVAALAVMGGGMTNTGLTINPPSAWAGAQDTKQVGLCLLKNCQLELTKCILNPKCLSNLICLQTCTNAPDETTCQIGCGDLFENEVVGEFNKCAVSQKRCVKQRADDGSYPIPSDDALVKSFNLKQMTGQWYISAGLNPTFDIFDCQVHFFTNPKPGVLVGKLNWRIEEPDGEFFTRDAVQSFVQQKGKPGLLLNHDNDYLHYQDDWYILDFEPESHVLVYYRGKNDAWDGYGGAVLYTRLPTVPDEIIPRVRAACEKGGISWDKFIYTDNSCESQEVSPSLLREEYAKKLLILSEEQLQQQLTAVRGYAASEVEGVEKTLIKDLEVSTINNTEVPTAGACISLFVFTFCVAVCT
ncbi:unnamed protein product [Chrysoparadoxa australica]